MDLRILYFSLFGEKDKIKIVVFNLPAFLAKFAGHDVTVNKSIWGPMYDGSRQCSLSPQETRLRLLVQTESPTDR